jgi:carbon monoxide dehydrogenase subunit G
MLGMYVGRAVKLEDTFDVSAPPERVWAFMLDLEQVTPCMPGAELTELPDPRTWKGKVKIKLGAVSLAYAATAVIAEQDEQARRVVIDANGRETRGKGTAKAKIESHLEPAGDGTRVVMSTDLTISGPVAQYGRGMIADVSKRLTGEFAECLSQRIAAPVAAAEGAAEAQAAGDGDQGTPAPAEPAPVAKPIGGLRLGAWALWRAIVRFFRRIGGAIAGLFRRG